MPLVTMSMLGQAPDSDINWLNCMNLKISHKLALILVTAVLLLVVLMVVGLQWSFDRSFISYINQREQNQVVLMQQAIGDSDYSWAQISQSKRLWHNLMRQLSGQKLEEQVNSSAHKMEERRPPRNSRPGERVERPYDGRPEQGFRPRPPHPGRPMAGHRPPPRGDFQGRRPPPEHEFQFERRPQGALSDGPPPGSRPSPPPGPPPEPGRAGDIAHLMMLDVDKNMIHGNERDIDQLQLTPVSKDGVLLGYLGLLPRQRVEDELDVLFAQEQMNAMWMIGAGVILLALLLSGPFASLLVSPVKRSSKAIHQLMDGDYEVVVPEGGKDELGQLSRDINRLAHSLKAHETSRRRWIADISHELRTPVAVLKGEIEAMQDGIRPMDKQQLASLFEEGQRLQRLVEDLYQLTLSDSGSLNYRFEKVDILKLVDRLDQQFEEELDAHEMEFAYSIIGKPKVFDADPQRLMQLLQNLMQNSLRYTDAGGQIQVDCCYAKTFKLVWQDSSPGVAEENIPKLFDRLFREDKSRARAQGGAGLGLSICQRIAEGHQGEITAEASKLGGLKITVELPLA